MPRHQWQVLFAWIAVCTAPVVGDDAYFRVSRDELAKVARQKLPTAAPPESEFSWTKPEAQFYRPYAVVGGKGEAFVVGDRGLPAMSSPYSSGFWTSPTLDTSYGAMFIRAPAGADVKGR